MSSSWSANPDTDLREMLLLDQQLKEKKLSFIRRLPGMRDAPTPVVEKLAEDFRYDTMEHDEVFCREGDYGECMFFLISGRARCEIKGTKIRDFSEGSFFGEMAAIYGQIRTATIVALTPCRYFVVYREALLEAIVAQPQFGIEMEKIVVQRLVECEYAPEIRQRGDVHAEIMAKVEVELSRRAAGRPRNNNTDSVVVPWLRCITRCSD